MKRSQLKPSTKPLRRRKPLSKVSAKRKDWLREYNELWSKDCDIQICAHCGIPYAKVLMERHHPFGRSQSNLLKYVYLCGTALFVTGRGCDYHMWIHRNGKEARKLGWLQPEYDRKTPSDDTPKPWRCEPQRKNSL